MHRLPGLLVVLPNAVGVQLQLIIGIIVIVSLLERTGTLPEAGAGKNIICMTNQKLALSLYTQNCGAFCQNCDEIGCLLISVALRLPVQDIPLTYPAVDTRMGYTNSIYHSFS